MEARGSVIVGKSTGWRVGGVEIPQRQVVDKSGLAEDAIGDTRSGSQREAVVNFYDRWILPPILDLVMRQSQLEKYRREVVAAASGRVLEVGVGSGLNFPLYGKRVETVVGIDPSPRLLAIARRRADAASIRAELLQGSATAIPLADSNRHGRDDLDALLDHRPAGRVT